MIPMLIQKQPSDKRLENSRKNFTEEGFGTKIQKVARKAGIKLVYYAMMLFYTFKADTTSMNDKMLIAGALGYFILPLDLMPDILPMVGYTDDLAAIIAIYKRVKANVTPAVCQEAKDATAKLFGEFDTKVLE